MTLEETVFSSYRFIPEKLLEYGFVHRDEAYSFSFDFFEGAFSATLTISNNGCVQGKVIENEFGDEYVAFRIESFHGEYVAKVREAYKEALLDIRAHCYEKDTFASPQANRIASKILERYNEPPDFPFKDKKYDSCGVFRVASNLKWYGIIMNVSRKVLGFEEGEPIDVLNVKIDESKRDEVLSIPGIYPSYHMSKTKWVSIVLDDSLEDETVLSLIEESRELVIKKHQKKKS